ncbi:MAG TPA: prepilin-type N-terminal cleavage/methylation domain-containing protein [Thermogutta sp.]|nr:prepilin-type N-terminal cleavage/methylation domain-containing protein [Thermogutta sp.]
MKRRSGFTLVEILVATAISLIMLGAVVAVFASVMQSINQARAVLETSDRLRSAAELLRADLKGLTVIPVPPRDPANNEGYFEYTEGPIGQNGQIRPFAGAHPLAVVNLDDLDAAGNPYQDSTVGDNDDILMFTTRSTGRPFVGRCLVSGQPTTIESDVAEVAWFVRGNRLYRRLRIVAPKAMALCDVNANGRLDPAEWIPANDTGAVNFNRYYDVAVHFDRNAGGWVFSTLGDLTKPENRYAHLIGDPLNPASFPFHPHRAGWQPLGLPTLAESASAGAATTWLTSGLLPALSLTSLAAPLDKWDLWTNPYPVAEVDPQTGLLRTVGQLYRESEDLVLTNVVAFDVKIWDPTAPIGAVQTGGVVRPGDLGFSLASTAVGRGAYVDLAYAPTTNPSVFSGVPLAKTRLASAGLAVYDTWSSHYEKDGIDQDGVGGVDTGTDGFDNDNDGLVDEFDEWEAPPPYPAPCRGIQITIRVFEPDSRQLRQVTIMQDFLPK